MMYFVIRTIIKLKLYVGVTTVNIYFIFHGLDKDLLNQDGLDSSFVVHDFMTF